MDHRKHFSFVCLLVIGCAVYFGAGLSVYSAAPTVDDPFAALQISRVAEGAPTAPFDLKSLEGGSLRSGGLAGKVVLMNFWATWCGPCKEEMPSLARLQAQFDPAQVSVITVTADMHPQGIKQFLSHLGIKLPVLFDENQEVSRMFMVRGLPTTVLIAKDGSPLGRAVGPRAWDSKESVTLVRHVLEGHP